VSGVSANCGDDVDLNYKIICFLVFAPLVMLCFGSCKKPSINGVAPDIPRGYVSTLEIKWNGGLYRFGPFVGYYFAPKELKDISRLEFVCFNEMQFYTKDIPKNGLIFVGEAILVRLSEDDLEIPPHKERIHPVFFQEAPPQWLENRPVPQDEFIHFHSCYDDQGHVNLGYWLRHVATKDFLYDMGGRVGPESQLYHSVRKGVDRDFARIIEFDEGPS
jgi:hypothetical protein